MARLVVSLSGIRSVDFARCIAFAEQLDARAVPLSVLIAPGTRRDRAVREWLARRCDAVVMHGFARDDARLPAHEAGLLLTAARRALEPCGTAAFASPRGQASPGTLIALRRNGFRLCTQQSGVRDLRTDRVLSGRALDCTRGPRALIAGTVRSARKDQLVRITVAATELPTVSGAILQAVDTALSAGAHPVNYPELAAPSQKTPQFL